MSPLSDAMRTVDEELGSVSQPKLLTRVPRDHQVLLVALNAVSQMTGRRAFSPEEVQVILDIQDHLRFIGLR